MPPVNDKERMPLTNPATGMALPKREQPGYYPGFSTLKQKRYWDAATRKVIEERVSKQKPIRFFTPEEARTMHAVVDRILPQEDRTEERRIPILPEIDERLYENRLDGYRFEDMPPDQEAYRIAARAFEEMAQTLHGRAFHELTVREQEEILKSIHEAKPQAAQELWKQMNIERFWALLVSDVVAVYYAHPWAWDEIGFGGPAYPRGYMRLEEGEPEPWEVGEQRYEWRGACRFDQRCRRDACGRGGASGQPRTGRHALSLFEHNAPLGGAFEKPKDDVHRLGAMQQIKVPPRRFKDTDLIDFAIVGVGSAGGVLLQRLARAGFKVVGFEAGPFWDTERDWVSRRSGLAQPLLERPAHHGRRASARAGREQQRQRCGRRISALGCVCAALSSFGLRGVHARRRGRGLADYV